MLRHWPDDEHATPADLADCRAAIRVGSRTFYAASLMLPLDVRASSLALYAFCRLADDVIDQADDAARVVPELHARLDSAYRGAPAAFAADRAFCDVVQRHAIPKALPRALIEGFEWDAHGRRYEDIDALYGYAARVAGTVGAMMALLMDVRDPGALARACDLGVAMQLSNIARDVGEDARMGRLYLPLAWLREAGIDEEGFLANPVFTPALGAVVSRLLRAADALYARATEGIEGLPSACRPAIRAARLLYAEIGREVERQGHDSITRRAVVPAARKVWLLLRAIARMGGGRTPVYSPALEQVHFLIDAVVRGEELPQGAPMLGAAGANAGAAGIDGRVKWLVELFERVERRRART
jgi:phytoene synthase